MYIVGLNDKVHMQGLFARVRRCVLPPQQTHAGQLLANQVPPTQSKAFDACRCRRMNARTEMKG